MNKDQVFDELKKRGIATVEIGFCGGNDEGGVEEISLIHTDGNVSNMQEHYSNGTWNSETQRWDKPELTGDQELSVALCAPVYDKYSTFAGEFYVNGTLVWDVAKREAKLRGNEQVSHDEPFEEDI